MNKKQTKIVATISDIRCSKEFIQELFDNGMNVARLNTAHQSPSDTLKVVNSIRSVSKNIGILIDTKGPEIRTSNLKEAISVEKGDEVFIGKDLKDQNSFDVTYEKFVDELSVGAQILIDDGSLSLKVVEKTNNSLKCVAENKSFIKNKKSINVPGVHLNLPALNEKDKTYIQFAMDNNIDFIAHSFVRNKNDLKEIQDILDVKESNVKIISKIENCEGVDNIDEIIENSAGVMVARGDLGIEIPSEAVPAIQKRIINKCIKSAKPVITATQLLHSMIENPRPTRAEVSDVANAVFDGTDAVMLSGETAFGEYPIESIQTMARIVKKIESEKSKMYNISIDKSSVEIRDFLAKTAVKACLELPIKSIVIDTDTGRSAKIVSAYRGSVPIYVKTSKERVVRELSLTYGVYPSYMELPNSTDEMVEQSLTELLDQGKIKKEDLVLVLARTKENVRGANFVEINTAQLVLEGHRKE